ncbi:MAG: aminotransferase class I/II-fold pyridoxal phosphate-dependent enzyme [Acidimicrobiia bacterium]|nr:aminotransferase class I/II-fold pyridoxal phosphate-dependent enzyme [Acidimicrobiia bacterium]
MVKPSARSNVAPFYVMEVMRAAEQRERAGHEVLHLEVGQPSTGAPAGAVAAVSEIMQVDNLGYTGAAGMPRLRDRIGRWYRDRHQIDVATERIVVTTGASGSCVLTFLAAFDHGQRVGVLEPGYPCYRNDLQALGADVVAIQVGHDTGFRPTITQLDAALPLDGLVIASPSNPTGTVLPPAELRAVVNWATDHQVTLIVDEIYHGITYDVECPSALQYGDDLIVFNSFSKYFSMTGWRLGWVVAPPAMAAAIERLSQSLTIAPPTVSQVAGLAAFDCTDELDANVDRYRRNRTVMLEGLGRAGLSRYAPADGAFYVWADVSRLVGHVGGSSQDLAGVWLDELGVAATPGIDFDRQRGHDFIRFSYATATDAITEAMDRIGAWVEQIGP